jgi:hypothetical protein
MVLATKTTAITSSYSIVLCDIEKEIPRLAVRESIFKDRFWKRKAVPCMEKGQHHTTPTPTFSSGSRMHCIKNEYSCVL